MVNDELLDALHPGEKIEPRVLLDTLTAILSHDDAIEAVQRGFERGAIFLNLEGMIEAATPPTPAHDE